MEVVFKLNDDDLDVLKQHILNMPGLAEEIINEYLHNEAPEKVIANIKKNIPVGVIDKKNSKGYPRTHAKYSDSLEFSKINLGFAVRTKRSPFFGYLYFPAFGEGTSKKNAPNPFFNNGLEESRPLIVENLVRLLSSNLEGGNK